jgi:hypothetical protein
MHEHRPQDPPLRCLEPIFVFYYRIFCRVFDGEEEAPRVHKGEIDSRRDCRRGKMEMMEMEPIQNALNLIGHQAREREGGKRSQAADKEVPPRKRDVDNLLLSPAYENLGFGDVPDRKKLE